MDYIKLVKDIVEPLVNNPEQLNFSVDDDGKTKLIKVTTNNSDTAKLIGKGGIVADSIRETVNVAAKLNNERVYVKFFSLEDNK